MRWLVLWWGVVMSSGCAPVFVADEYVALGEVVPGADGCSWSYVGGGMAVTALHCVEKIDPALILEKTWDAALIALDPMKLELPDVPTCAQTGDVGWMSIVCYADHRGEPNCGHVLWSNGDSITFAAEAKRRSRRSTSVLSFRKRWWLRIPAPHPFLQPGTRPSRGRISR